MNIMLIDSNFHGANDSFTCFIREIREALLNIKHNVYLVTTEEDIHNVYQHKNIDFSLGIGKYPLYNKKYALCDFYNKLHYQWIIDNPLKIKCPVNIKNLIPILIDQEFIMLHKTNGRKPLYLPLGVSLKKNKTEELQYRKKGVVFSGQVKDLSILAQKINANEFANGIWHFINDYCVNLDESYIKTLVSYLKLIPNKYRTDFFSLTNSYIRSYKRHFVLNKINRFPLILIGEIPGVLLNKENVCYLGKLTYQNSNMVFAKYTHVLNISPNYSYCLHDRILRALSAGCHVISDYIPIAEQQFGNFYRSFKYRDLATNDFMLDSMFEEEIKDREKYPNYLQNYCWESLLQLICEDYKRRGIQYD